MKNLDKKTILIIALSISVGLCVGSIPHIAAHIREDIQYSRELERARIRSEEARTKMFQAVAEGVSQFMVSYLNSRQQTQRKLPPHVH